MPCCYLDLDIDFYLDLDLDLGALHCLGAIAARGFDLNAPDSSGRTALHIACSVTGGNSKQVASTLVASGADFNVLDSEV